MNGKPTTTPDERQSGKASAAIVRRRFLIAEYCDHEIYEGWHLYIRESKSKQQPNSDGRWGWIRQIGRHRNPAQDVLESLGIVMTGDGTCDHDGVAEIARRFPIPRERVGGQPRGCIEVEIDDYWRMTLPS